jgi:hypothetical protein
MNKYQTIGIILAVVFIQFCALSIAYNYGAIGANIECIKQDLDRMIAKQKQ